MKQIIVMPFFILFCLFNFNCSDIKNNPQPESVKVQSKQADCDTSKADSLLMKLSESFKPDKIGLDKCLPASFDTLLNNVDTDCLRSLLHYKYSVILILVKLYDYHIQVGHQGYDLYSMKSGASKIIIDEFELIGGYKNKKLEMLNSGTVLDVIDKEPELKVNPIIKRYYEQINIEIKRQEKAGY